MKQVMFIVTVACAHHEVPTFAETSIKPHPHFLVEWFYSIAGSVHVVIGGYILLSENGGLLIRVYVCGGKTRHTRSPHFPPHFPIHECTPELKRPMLVQLNRASYHRTRALPWNTGA